MGNVPLSVTRFGAHLCNITVSNVAMAFAATLLCVLATQVLGHARHLRWSASPETIGHDASTLNTTGLNTTGMMQLAEADSLMVTLKNECSCAWSGVCSQPQACAQ